MYLKAASQMVTAALLGVTFFNGSVEAAIYRIDLKNNSTVLSTRTIDTTKPASTGGVSHGNGGGFAIEVADTQASCGVFIQQQTGKAKSPSDNVPANVMVSLIATQGPVASRTVISNSGLLSKHTISDEDQDVLPNSAGSRSVSVDALKLRRSCTVSVL